MNEPVAAAYFLEEDEADGVIEEVGVVAGGVALDDEDEAESVVLDDGKAAVVESNNQPKNQPTTQPTTQPNNQPNT